MDAARQEQRPLDFELFDLSFGFGARYALPIALLVQSHRSFSSRARNRCQVGGPWERERTTLRADIFLWLSIGSPEV
jgi:hypothetical protein